MIISFSTSFFDQQYRQDEVFGLIVALFAILAIFISCMGLAVLVMFSCSTRIREMGIRKVLGASRRQLFFELGREFFLLIAIAVVIAFRFRAGSWGIAESLFVPHGLESVVLPRSGRFYCV